MNLSDRLFDYVRPDSPCDAKDTPGSAAVHETTYVFVVLPPHQLFVCTGFDFQNTLGVQLIICSLASSSLTHNKNEGDVEW
jgi:hypothetical protein